MNKNIEKEKDEKNKDKLKKERDEIIEDINYVKYYPRTYKYYSLFPNKDSDNEDMIKKREKMKQKIKFFLNNKKEHKDKGKDYESFKKKKIFKDDFFELDE